MLRKEILTVREKIYTISLAVGKLEEKLLKENTGSDKGKLVPTDIGQSLLISCKEFWKYIDYNFTAKEQDFDEIAEGNVNWTDDAGIL
jgi:DNA topoisomerase-1